MKKLFIFCSILFTFSGIKAQQYPLFTNYLTNCFGFNPAIAGTTDFVDARFVYRSQWVNVDDAPKTGIFTLHGGMKSKPFGFGGMVFNDVAGKLKRTGFSGVLSYKQSLGDNTTLSLGVSAGYYRFNLVSDYLLTDPDDPITTSAVTGLWAPDFNIGLYLRSKALYVGVSIPQIFERDLAFSQDFSTSKLKRHYFGFAGYTIPLSENVSVEPSVLVKFFPTITPQFDFSAKLNLYQFFWLGGSYRAADAAAAMCGFQFKNGMSLSYAYDFTTSSFKNANAGSHEITLGLAFGRKKDRDNDGVPDDEDECPDVPGPKENKGCPLDRDKDGVADDVDKCPDTPGVKENDGCPLNDRDKDGVPDHEDKCPDVPGKKEFQGCPDDKYDSDGDGVPDIIDMCPNVKGVKENSGCPYGDRDNDGIRDDIDKCPDIPGTLENGGCPIGDRDQDGILDSVDPCPDEAGPISNMGCPPGKGPNANTNDRDGDGIVDAMDKCPNTAGPLENQGCPVVSKRAQNILDLAIKNVYFDFDRAELRPESFRYLDDLVQLMNENAEYNVHMEGHTDSRGTSEYNMQLSKNRVYAVFYYLIGKGVSPDRLSVSFFGESRPIASNLNESGRQQNRRVEMKFLFD